MIDIEKAKTDFEYFYNNCVKVIVDGKECKPPHLTEAQRKTIMRLAVLKSKGVRFVQIRNRFGIPI